MEEETEYGSFKYWNEQLYKDRMQKRIYANALVYALKEEHDINDAEFVDTIIEKIYLINGTINFDKKQLEKARKREK